MIRFVERVAQIFTSFDDADDADEAFYASLEPSDRVDILLELMERYRSSLGATSERLERIYRVTQLERR